MKYLINFYFLYILFSIYNIIVKKKPVFWCKIALLMLPARGIFDIKKNKKISIVIEVYDFSLIVDA